ncbi:hypothetical protein [Roseibium sp.]|uniref:hypothetical protein n=1 Tax=Roseibium sp. TaxID=1936156 RepID=UPI003A97E57C
MIPEHPKKLARIGAILSLLGSLIWIQWPLNLEEVSPAALTIFMGCLITWVAIEIADLPNIDKSRQNEVNQDAEKLNFILKKIDFQQSYILKNYAIETYIEQPSYDGLKEIRTYHDEDRFPFHNKEMQKAFDEFCLSVSVFLNALYGLYTADGRGNITWRPGGTEYVPETEYELIKQEICIITDKKVDCSNKWDKFLIISNNALKDSTIRIEKY